MFGTKVLEASKSKFNKDIKVIKSIGFGTYIQVNGLTQSGGVVESIWRETLKRIKIKKLENILILGLGGGTVAKLLRKKYPNSKLTGIEIDPLMIELGNKYLKLEKSNIKVLIQDAYKFNKGKFDLIIVDIYCGSEFPKKFEGEIFLKNVNNLLSKGGVVIFNRLFYKDNKNKALEFGNKLEKYFKEVNLFYPQANLMIFCGR